MHNCKTCNYWEAPNSGLGDVPNVGRCCAVAQYWNVACWNDEGERELLPDFKDTLAFVQDGSDYYASLRTTAEFGCVMHKEKEN